VAFDTSIDFEKGSLVIKLIFKNHGTAVSQSRLQLHPSPSYTYIVLLSLSPVLLHAQSLLLAG
jgi:hypothetical protein